MIENVRGGRRAARRATTLVVGLVTCGALMSACGKGGEDSDTAKPDTGMAVGADTAAAAQAASGMTDANIVYLLDHANMADSARGKVAESKATNADVKQFGQMMMGEHHALRAQGQALATKLGVTPAAPAGDASEAKAKVLMDSLQAVPKGAAWDRAYIAMEVAGHQEVLDLANKALQATQNAELKDLIQKAAPIIQKHLDRAKEIQGKLGS
jgi:putative membrane protein